MARIARRGRGTAQALVSQLCRELTPVGLQAGRSPPARIAALAAEQLWIGRSDRFSTCCCPLRRLPVRSIPVVSRPSPSVPIGPQPRLHCS